MPAYERKEPHTSCSEVKEINTGDLIELVAECLSPSDEPKVVFAKTKDGWWVRLERDGELVVKFVRYVAEGEQFVSTTVPSSVITLPKKARSKQVPSSNDALSHNRVHGEVPPLPTSIREVKKFNQRGTKALKFSTYVCHAGSLCVFTVNSMLSPPFLLLLLLLLFLFLLHNSQAPPSTCKLLI